MCMRSYLGTHEFPSFIPSQAKPNQTQCLGPVLLPRTTYLKRNYLATTHPPVCKQRQDKTRHHVIDRSASPTKKNSAPKPQPYFQCLLFRVGCTSQARRLVSMVVRSCRIGWVGGLKGPGFERFWRLGWVRRAEDLSGGRVVICLTWTMKRRAYDGHCIDAAHPVLHKYRARSAHVIQTPCLCGDVP